MNALLLISYIVFIWFVLLHTLEEIACDIMETQIGHIHMTRNKYLLGVAAISTLNLTTLSLLILNIRIGAYLGLFCTAVFGIFQAIVHTVGYFKEHRKCRGLGAGFYSAIPLAVIGLITFLQLLNIIIN
ncbi:MAG: hypothetical protein JEZ00_07260 [Anaerolineaceae bacterium]|nr:hypothetical protein [Anaerolineaceae bacterium]